MEILELKKHSALIAMSNRGISVPQRKLYNAILYLSAKQIQEDSSKNIFKLKFADVVKFSGYNDFTNTKYLKKSIKELVETVVEYNMLGKDNLNEWGVFSLLAQATIKEYEEHITIAFPPLILNNISVPNIYSLLNLSIVNSLSGKYSLPIYEILADYKKVHKVGMSIATFRQILGIAEDEYNNITNFKNKVIIPAINEINKATDLTIEYNLEKNDSRSYTDIIFSIKDKYQDLNHIESGVFQLLKSKGVHHTSARRFAKLLSKQNIMEALEHLEKAIKKGSVKNVAAYLTKILQTSDNTKNNPVEILTPDQKLDESKSIEKKLLKLEEFKAYTKQRIDEIIASMTEEQFSEFVQNQSDFGIEHLIEKGLIDKSKNIINKMALIQNSIFLGWIEKNYFDRDIEFKIFSS